MFNAVFVEIYLLSTGGKLYIPTLLMPSVTTLCETID